MLALSQQCVGFVVSCTLLKPCGCKALYARVALNRWIRRSSKGNISDRRCKGGPLHGTMGKHNPNGAGVQLRQSVLSPSEPLSKACCPLTLCDIAAVSAALQHKSRMHAGVPMRMQHGHAAWLSPRGLRMQYYTKRTASNHHVTMRQQE